MSKVIKFRLLHRSFSHAEVSYYYPQYQRSFLGIKWWAYLPHGEREGLKRNTQRGVAIRMIRDFIEWKKSKDQKTFNVIERVEWDEIYDQN